MIIELTGIVTPLVYELGKEFIKEKILPKKAEAKHQMEIVLFELKQIYQTFEIEFEKFRLLSFSNNHTIYYSERDLNIILKKDYEDKFDESRGHCDKIVIIYNEYLKRWFFDLLLPEKAKKLDSLFSTMSQFDDEMLGHMENFINWIKPNAKEALKLVSEGKYQLAEENIKQACDKFEPSIERVRILLKDISHLQNDWK